ncbi:MAG: hypothetical protein AUG51_21620 [Acidobacteria bacterium 13_1_20CM_3_53_8]|nr:MAG: hypothetical protein AUG51_21620 [Acidobacteria bacterium 13_1_20CM_3_53_8]
MSVLEEDLNQERGLDEPLDPLQEKQEPPDRVFYATGVLLDEDDFRAEQVYHRGRLARVLTYLHGSGTAAGLRVGYKPPSDPNSETDTVEEITVEPGVAIDRLGRMIEVPRDACIRLNPWFNKYDPDALREAYIKNVEIPAHTEHNVSIKKHSVNGVVVDLFIRFLACARGKTPAFASGPFDALDAVQPSRLRDGYKLKLFPRKDHRTPPPEKFWPTKSALLPDAIFNMWKKLTARDQMNKLEPLSEHLADQDTTYVFLARIILPTEDVAIRVDANQRPVRRRGDPVEIINNIRPFVYSTNALARLAGLP